MDGGPEARPGGLRGGCRRLADQGLQLDRLVPESPALGAAIQVSRHDAGRLPLEGAVGTALDPRPDPQTQEASHDRQYTSPVWTASSLAYSPPPHYGRDVETPVVVEVPGGPTLEAGLDLGEPAAGGLVLCHPHPLYGGDMDNPVVTRAAEVARALGVSTLRFNFRGVGGSTGAHDEGWGEQDDCRAALDALRARLAPASPLGLLGYSFGARIAAQVGAGRDDLAGLALVAPPLAMYDFDGLPTAGPLLLVAGSRDPYCPVQELVKLAARVGTEPRIIEGAEHFFFGKLFPLGTAIEGWLRGWLPGRAS